MIATKDDAASRPGEYVLEVREQEGGEVLRRVKVYVTAEVIEGKIVYRCRPVVLDGNDEDDLGLMQGEHSFQCGINEKACPAKALNQALEVEALRAYSAKKQIDTFRSMGLPTTMTPTATE